MTPDNAFAGRPAEPAETLQPEPDYKVIDVGSVFDRFWKRRLTILITAFTCAVIGYAITFALHPAYDATVRLMPPTQKQNLLASFSPSRNEGDFYLGIATSRTVTDDVIEHQHLAEYFHITQPSRLRASLQHIAKIQIDKDQFITIIVRADEPETAQRIANEYPQAIDRLNHAIALAQATHRFDYYEGPLEAEKNKLADAEESLKLTEQKTGVILPEAQVQLGLTAISQLKQQITVRQEQKAALETSSTAQNPKLVQLNSQIASLEAQLHRMEAQNGGQSSSGGEVPELTMEIARKARDVKFHEALFEILSHQYENARTEDSYAPSIELVDRAVLPDDKSWPSRRIFALIGFFTGALLSVAVLWFRR